MNRKLAGALILVSATGVAFAGAHEKANEGADLAKAETCIQCHEAMGMSLKGRGADAIAASIKSFSGPDSSHEDVMPGASDADIAEVARLLNEKG